MRRRIKSLCLILFVLALLPGTPAQDRARPVVVLISVDGLKPDYVTEADKHGLKIPTLRRFVREGAFATSVTGVMPTVTYPSHTTMVTGVAPARHGIVANTPFDPFGKNQAGWNWYAEDIRVPTLWDACSKAGLTTASVDWPVTVGAGITYRIPQVWRAGTPHDRKLIRALSTPGLLAEAEKAAGAYPEGQQYDTTADERRVRFNVYLIESKKPSFVTTYFSGLDHTQHALGPYSAEAKADLERIDRLVGQVWAAAASAGRGHAVVCVVSDHGFAPTRKGVRLNAALREAGLIELDESGKVKSWRAMAWNSGGSAAVMLQDPRDNEARDKAREVLRRLAADPASGLLRIYEEDEARKLGGFPDATFIAGVKPGFYFGSGFEMSVIHDIRPGGGHGYLPELPEMDAAFFIAGSGLPNGRNLGRIDMRDIAPTLAHLLKVDLPGAEGRNVLER